MHSREFENIFAHGINSVMYSNENKFIRVDVTYLNKEREIIYLRRGHKYFTGLLCELAKAYDVLTA